MQPPLLHRHTHMPNYADLFSSQLCEAKCGKVVQLLLVLTGKEPEVIFHFFPLHYVPDTCFYYYSHYTYHDYYLLNYCVSDFFPEKCCITTTKLPLGEQPISKVARRLKNISDLCSITSVKTQFVALKHFSMGKMTAKLIQTSVSAIALTTVLSKTIY